jgi:hypothetical protein
LIINNNNTPERVVRLFICVPFLLVACSASDDNARSETLIQVVGKIENKHLDEASGLARSTRESDLYWSMNDDGPAVVYALSSSGKHLGRVRIRDAKNRDWEDIASFLIDDTAYLIVADIGDNDSKYSKASLYVIEEPDPKDDEVNIAWQIDYKYPDGPRDAEALAVDAAGQHIYVLSKRTVPAELYRLPLRATSDDIVMAERVGVLASLPQPSERERRNAMSNGCGWQPTAMDFAADGSGALVLTYDGVNYFSRNPEQSWPEALQGQAMHLSLGKYKPADCKNKNAESITYAGDGEAAIVTFEKKHAPVLKIDLREIDP